MPLMFSGDLRQRPVLRVLHLPPGPEQRVRDLDRAHARPKGHGREGPPGAVLSQFKSNPKGMPFHSFGHFHEVNDFVSF